MTNRPFDYDIYIEAIILDHKRVIVFFKLVFSHPDEKGTVLSVHHDFLGHMDNLYWIFLLYARSMGIMFFGKTSLRIWVLH